jgi:hypothetical protein
VAQPILPLARPLFLCEAIVPRDRGKVDFLGAFDSISPLVYPHSHRNMFVVAHLSGGLGGVNTHIEVRRAETDGVVGMTPQRVLAFPNREVLVRLAQGVQGVTFAQPGIYLIELYCENTCIADTRLILKPPLIRQPGGHE